jgi:16S rRNA (uracil1498-N3)-methyltransferase
VAHRFHSDLPALFVPEGFTAESPLTLPTDEAQHVRALRLREGAGVLLLDGRGGRARATIERFDRRGTIVRTGPVSFDGAETGPYIALSYGLLADKSRIEWCIEKGVELGVRQFLPLETERSEGHLHRSRLERVAIAALKQSQRSWLATIEEPAGVSALAARAGEFDRVYLCHESAPLESALASRLVADRPQRTLVAIGPEGGFSEREVEELAAAGAVVVSLGDARLRAETAAIVAVALVRMIADNDHGLGSTLK